MKTQEEGWNVGLPSFKILLLLLQSALQSLVGFGLLYDFDHSKLALLIDNSQYHMKGKDICAWPNFIIFAGD